MKIKYKNGETAEVSDSFGQRLIEQGAAVVCTEKPKAKAEPKAEPKKKSGKE